MATNLIPTLETNGQDSSTLEKNVKKNIIDDTKNSFALEAKGEKEKLINSRSKPRVKKQSTTRANSSMLETNGKKPIKRRTCATTTHSYTLDRNQ